LALLGRKIAVAIPDTLLEEKDSLRDKTAKLGLVARACAIYGVDIVEVFRDEMGRGEGEFVKKVLEYVETPQYLRRRLYPLEAALQYAGLLPPLRIPSHKPKVPVGSLTVGEVREGIANQDGTVDIGLGQPVRLDGKGQAGKRVTVRIRSKDPLAAEPVSRDMVREYWGYRVEQTSLGEVLADKRFGLKIATSRLGRPLGTELPKLRESLARASGVKLIFGSPSRGLFQMGGPELGKKVDFVLNLFPEQKVETVRTEEAISAGLNLISILAIEQGRVR
jgi:predicted SPOUT superfamily RNA methylase MTH1